MRLVVLLQCTLLLLLGVDRGQSGAANVCPVVYLKDGCTPQESRSVCWSPGQLDVDCPNNGVCCFNGCSNQCGLPETDRVKPQSLTAVKFPTTTTTTTTTTATTTTTCSIVMHEVQETVMKEMCKTVPGREICSTSIEEDCEDVCRDQLAPAAPECTSQPQEVCVDKPCYPVEELVPMNDVECETSPAQCHTVAEEECTEEVVQECQELPESSCEEVVKFGADCGTQTQCKNVHQWVCPQQQDTPQSRYGRAVSDKKQPSKKFFLSDKKKSWSPYHVASDDGNKKYKRSVEEIKGLKQEVLDKSFEIKAVKINGSQEFISKAVDVKVSAVSGVKSVLDKSVRAKISGKNQLVNKTLDVKGQLADGAESIINAAANTKAGAVSGAKSLIKQTIKAKSEMKQALLEKSLTIKTKLINGTQELKSRLVNATTQVASFVGDTISAKLAIKRAGKEALIEKVVIKDKVANGTQELINAATDAKVQVISGVKSAVNSAVQAKVAKKEALLDKSLAVKEAVIKGSQVLLGKAIDAKAVVAREAQSLANLTIQAKNTKKRALLEAKSNITSAVTDLIKDSINVTSRAKQAFITNVAAGVRKLKGAVASKARSLKHKISSGVNRLKNFKKCRLVKAEKCSKFPYPNTYKCTVESCTNVDSVLQCANTTKPSCSMVDKEKCTPASETCTTITRQVAVKSTAHCPTVPEKNCHTVEKQVCTTRQKLTKVCATVCKPKEKRECKVGEPTKQCKQIPVVMTFKVPKKVC